MTQEFEMNNLDSEQGTNDPVQIPPAHILLHTPTSLASNPPMRFSNEEEVSKHQTSSNAGGLRWFHVPDNNASVIKKYINAVATQNGMGTPNSATKLNESWPSSERPVTSVPSSIVLPHSRFMEPGCRAFPDMDNKADKFAGAMSLFLPYMNWEEFKNIDGLHEQQKSSEASRKDGHYYHHRRTLDQFYYSGLADTKRDAEQTISKWTGDDDGKIPEDGRDHPADTSKLVMVDQLWLFVINKECILTFFPSHGAGETCTNLYNEVAKQASTCKNAYDLAALVTGQAMMLIFNNEYQKSADLFGIYQWAIAKKAARQIECFEKFLPSRRSTTSDTNEKELELMMEVADILDELNMLNSLLSKQEDVCKSFQRTLSEWWPKQNQAPPSLEFQIEQDRNSVANFDIGASQPAKVKILQGRDGMLNLSLNNNEVSLREQLGIAGTGGMSFAKSWSELRLAIENVERLRAAAKDTHDLLLSLLNLKQTAASLEESRATTKQGRAVMLFTIVTIVFLPLSFFTSYFGQNISEYTGDDKNPTSAQLWRIGGPISAIIIITALIMAYYISNPQSKLWSRLPRHGQRDTSANEDV